MASRDDDDGVLRSDAAFEKWLLAAAGSDGPRLGAPEAAWAQFAERAGAAFPDGNSPDEASARAALRESGAPAGKSAASVASGAAAKWAGLGALGGTLLGGLLATGVLRGGADSAPARRESSDASRTETPAASGSGVRAPELVTPGSPVRPLGSAGVAMRPPGASPGAPPRASRAPARNGAAGRARALSRPGSASAPPGAASPGVSSLEREVARLDAIRVANARGDYASALELVAGYRDEFEHGELARDADVFELEALAGAGERARVARAARAFLDRYPGDPHTQHVRALAAAAER